MDRNSVQYKPSELISMLEEGFAEIYRPFANYQRQQHPLWQKCIETISQHSILDKIIFCNDVVHLPPVKLFICLHPEVAGDKKLCACDKKFVGCFWSYLFTTIFCYRFKKQVGIKNPCIKTALYFFDRPDNIIIVPDEAESAKVEPKETTTASKNKKKQEATDQ